MRENEHRGGYRLTGPDLQASDGRRTSSGALKQAKRGGQLVLRSPSAGFSPSGGRLAHAYVCLWTTCACQPPPTGYCEGYGVIVN